MASALRVKPQQPETLNQMWAMAFMHDTLKGGRHYRTLNIVDCFSREVLAVEVHTSLSGHSVARVLHRLLETRGKPSVIQVDNGPEFAGRALDEWANKNQVKLHFIEPGKPTQNGVIEYFYGKMRDECLNLEWFIDLHHARGIIENWCHHYNTFFLFLAPVVQTPIAHAQLGGHCFGLLAAAEPVTNRFNAEFGWVGATLFRTSRCRFFHVNLSF